MGKLSEEAKAEIRREIDEETHERPVRLSWKQAVAAGSVVLTALGGSFSAGVKVQSEIGKVEKIKLERELQRQIADLEGRSLELARDAKAFASDCEFYKARYRVIEERLKEATGDE